MFMKDEVLYKSYEIQLNLKPLSKGSPLPGLLFQIYSDFYQLFECKGVVSPTSNCLQFYILNHSNNLGNYPILQEQVKRSVPGICL